MKIYDLIVIGAGPAGVVAAKTAAEKGMCVLLIEQGKELDKRRSLTCGWFGRGLFLFDRVELEDPVFGKTKEVVDIVSLIKRLSGQKVNVVKPFGHKDGKYCRFPDNFGFSLASYYYNKVNRMANNVFNAESLSIVKNKYFEVNTTKGVFSSNRCLIATGKNSIEWIKEICGSFGLRPSESSVKIGVRVEVPTFRVNDALVELGDIKVSCGNAECDDSRTDSFVGEWGDSNILSAFGHCMPGKQSSRTNFMVGAEVVEEEALRDVQIVNVLTNDKIRKERVEDYMNDKSVLKHIDEFKGLKNVFNELEKVVPSFISYAIMYVPEIRLRGVLPVDSFMRTAIPGLYGAGECSSRVSNLIGAMASGLVAAKTIIKE